MARHTARSLVSPDPIPTAEQLVVEFSRGLKRLQKKNPPASAAEIWADLGPRLQPLHRAAEAIERKRERPTRAVLREVEEDEPEASVDPLASEKADAL